MQILIASDLREMVLIGREEQNWLLSSFLPRAIKFGFKQIAIITPKSYFNKVAVESISYRIDKEKISLQFFENKEKAIDWLNTPQTSVNNS